MSKLAVLVEPLRLSLLSHVFDILAGPNSGCFITENNIEKMKYFPIDE